jgi:beta-1,2-mannosidase
VIDKIGRLARGTVAMLALPVALAHAQRSSWMLGPFTKPAGVNPIITPGATATVRSPLADSIVRWEQFATFNPAAVVRDGKVYVLYRAEDATGDTVIGGHTSRIGLAESADGLHFRRRPVPVLFPDRDAQQQNEWPGGVEDPRIVEREDGEYVLTYTQWNRKVPKLAVATSRDLVHWTKHGPAFPAKYQASETKSGAIVCRFVGDRCLAARIDGKYWMYFNVPRVLVATSDDLVAWTPIEDDNGRPLEVLAPRPGYFDSWLVEAGAPAVLTDRGIVLLYNAGNSERHGDPTVPARTYTAGQALFDARNPVRLIARADAPFLRPSEAYERSGQYKEGTTFVEGLVRFKGRWLLYYGTADSRVAVAAGPER